MTILYKKKRQTMIPRTMVTLVLLQSSSGQKAPPFRQARTSRPTRTKQNHRQLKIQWIGFGKKLPGFLPMIWWEDDPGFSGVPVYLPTGNLNLLKDRKSRRARHGTIYLTFCWLRGTVIRLLFTKSCSWGPTVKLATYVLLKRESWSMGMF